MNNESTEMKDLRFAVPGMTCGHCVTAVEREIAKVPGVETVSVDLDTKAVGVTGTGIDRDLVRAAVDEAGYEAVE